eukprot:m.88323 g.88323  ORF g.88323 m.88323 type:complete len:853 (+) comp8805_c1_seq1:2084-4642(+)
MPSIVVPNNPIHTINNDITNETASFGEGQSEFLTLDDYVRLHKEMTEQEKNPNYKWTKAYDSINKISHTDHLIHTSADETNLFAPAYPTKQQNWDDYKKTSVTEAKTTNRDAPEHNLLKNGKDSLHQEHSPHSSIFNINLNTKVKRYGHPPQIFNYEEDEQDDSGGKKYQRMDGGGTNNRFIHGAGQNELAGKTSRHHHNHQNHETTHKQHTHESLRDSDRKSRENVTSSFNSDSVDEFTHPAQGEAHRHANTKGFERKPQPKRKLPKTPTNSLFHTQLKTNENAAEGEGKQRGKKKENDVVIRHQNAHAAIREKVQTVLKTVASSNQADDNVTIGVQRPCKGKDSRCVEASKLKASKSNKQQPVRKKISSPSTYASIDEGVSWRMQRVATTVPNIPFVYPLSRYCCAPHESEPGDLIFDSDFESGNLQTVMRISDVEYNLMIRADIESERHRLWFNFKVWNALEGQHVVFHILNFSKTKSLFSSGMSPVIRSKKRPKWERIGGKNVFFYRKSPTKKSTTQMSFVVVFDDPTDVYEFAYCYPYTYTHLQQRISYWKQHFRCNIQHSVLARTLSGLSCDMLTISAPKNFGKIERGETLPTIFITARIHPGETPASHICDGLITHLLGEDENVVELRNSFVIKVIPMLNPDGVYHGTYRCNTKGYDLNRCWDKCHFSRQPTIVAVKNALIQELEHNPVPCFIDLHGHTTNLSSFIYGNEYVDRTRMEEQWQLPFVLSETSTMFSLARSKFNSDTAKSGTGRRTIGSILGVQGHSYTLETSFYGFTGMNEEAVIPFTENKYKQLGQEVVDAMIQCYLPKFSNSDNFSEPSTSFSFATFLSKNAHEGEDEDDHGDE